MTNHEPKHPPADMAGLDGLIERLRAYPCEYCDTDCTKAADRIEALEAEIERLRERVKRVENNNRELRGSKERVYAATDLRQPTQSDAVQAEIEALRHDLERQMTIANEQVNEVERLREALAHIAFSGADGPYGEFGEALNEHQMRRVAKAALQEQSK